MPPSVACNSSICLCPARTWLAPSTARPSSPAISSSASSTLSRTAKSRAGRATAWIDRDLPLQARASPSPTSSVIGVAREGQMRRDFLAYLERERAHPYRTFLHYNSWYDLGYFNALRSGRRARSHQCLRPRTAEKRGVTLDSFLFDDGWDDHDSLWKFNAGFPDGFTPIKQAAEKYGAEPGVWMSPWGGYGKPKQERIDFGKSQGYEIVARRLRALRTEVLRGLPRRLPRHDAQVRRESVQVRRHRQRRFRLSRQPVRQRFLRGDPSDRRTARGEAGHLHQPHHRHVAVAVLAAAMPTRSGAAARTIDAAGVGPYRERWITYRDADTYRRHRAGRPALSAQLAHAARHDLCAAASAI